VVRIFRIKSAALHEFAVWMLENAPRLEQAAFQQLGLHEAVLSLFDSPANSARVYAADYVRTHARDIGLDHLIRLENNTHEAVRKLAFDLLSAKHSCKDVGLTAWGRILETRYGHDYAAKILSRQFGPRDLTPAWFKTLLLTPNARTIKFAKALFADDARQNSRFRLDANRFSAASVYAFCESSDDGTRELGMLLIRSYPQFQVPEALFRLTESPDRRMRAFVIRTIWSLYRQTGIT
jgi:hypothetical protein